MNDDPVDDVYIAGGGLSSFSLIWHVAKAWDLPNVPFSIRIAEKQGEGSLGIYTENVGYGGNEHTINLYGKLMQPQTGIKGRSLINPGVAELLQLPSEVPASTEDIGKYINKKRLSSVLHGRLRYLKVSTRNLPRGLFAGFPRRAPKPCHLWAVKSS
jgi:hypothetical protein